MELVSLAQHSDWLGAAERPEKPSYSKRTARPQPRYMPACGAENGASLRRTAGEAIEHEAVAAVGLCQPLGDDVDDDVVWHEFPAVQVPFGHPAEQGALIHVAPKYVAGGDVQYAEAGREPDRLGSLAGPGRAEQDDAQRPVGPSRAATLRLARPSQLRRGRRTRHLRTGCQAVPFGTYGRRGRLSNSSRGWSDAWVVSGRGF